MSSLAIPFDTLAYVKQLESAGIPASHAEAQAMALTSALQQVREVQLNELATKGDILRLEKEIEVAKVETIKWVIATGIVVLGGVAAIHRFAPVPVYYPAPQTVMSAPAAPQAMPAPTGK
ncbi:MAG: hypothetical protein HQL97_02730 [Magnetococcales bacterium]|nr:hypothetical protein [Magnetococcales bacterium]